MDKVTVDNVKKLAVSFFNRHWAISDVSAPTWNEAWGFIGTLPGHDKQGVYLLIGEDDEVLYIGVGASIGGGRYTGHGIGSRTNKYIRVGEGQRGKSNQDRQYRPVDKWADRGLSKIITLGFTEDFAYLSYGLEAYLLRECKTRFNIIRSARASDS